MVYPFNNLGALYHNIKEYKKAEKNYLEAIGIIQTVLKGKHPLYIGALKNLEDLYIDTKQSKKLENIQQQIEALIASEKE